MNNIVISNSSLPEVIETGFYTAENPFFHIHRTADFHVLILVVEGVIYVTEDEIDYEIKPGQMLFLKAGIYHYGKYEIPKKTKWYFVHFLMDEKHKNSRTIPKFLTGLKGTDIEEQTSKIVKDYYSTEEDVVWNININFFKLLSNLIEIENGKHPKKQTVADKIAEHIEANCCKEFSITELENIFFLSYKRMAAVFKKEKNCSMLTYWTNCRIKEACKLLQITDFSIGEIAAKTGYDDQLYFSRVFKQITGVSPKQWRRQSYK